MTRHVACRACLGYGHFVEWIGTQRYAEECEYCKGRGHVRMKTNRSVRGFEVLGEYVGLIDKPQRETGGSAGYDLQARVDELLEQGQSILIPTGLTAYMLPDEELQIRPRSGLSFMHGITVLNAPGTIDSDYYPKEIGVILINHSNRDFRIEKGDRIAQGVFAKVLFTDDDEPKDRVRESGFGHTGK